MNDANEIVDEELDDALKINLSVDFKGFSAKPNQNEIKSISNRIAGMSRYDKLEKLPIGLGVLGYSWCPAIFTDGKRTKDNFYSQQLFGLDFDNGITWEEVRERADKYRLPISFAYETFSSINRNKFRVVLCNDIQITDFRVSKVIQIALMEIFPECDLVCNDCSRIFFGGKGLIFVNKNINTDTFNISDLMFSLVEYYRDKDSINYLRLIKAYSEKVGIDLKNGYPKVEIIDEIQKSEISGATPILYTYIGNAPRISNSDDNLSYAIYLSDIVKTTKITKTKNRNEEVITYQTVNTKTGKRDLLRNFDFRDLIDSCRLFNEFAYGERWCYHNELWGIATNLCQIKGGGDAFIRAITNEFNEQYESYREKDWGYSVNYIQKQDYFPQQCANFCPYANECNHAKNMILTGKTKKNTIVELSNKKEYVSLAEAEKDLNDKFLKVQGICDDNIHVIKAQTGIGKSYTYIKFLENCDKPYIVAVPTNKLKDEIYDSCIEAGYNVMKTPVLPFDIPANVKDEIERLYEIGASFSAGNYIKKIAKKLGHIGLLDYIEQLDLIKIFTGHIITTHARLLYFKDEQFQSHNIIIDEDIMKSLMPINSVSIEDLLKVQRLKCISSMDMTEICNKFKQIFSDNEYKTFIKTEPIYVYNKEQIDNQIADNESGIESNTIGFLKSCVAYRYNADCEKMTNAIFYSDSDIIQYLVRLDLPEQKIIILSATLDEKIYKLMFGDRVIFHYCKDAKYKGNLTQYPQKSYSRYCMGQDEELFKKAKSIVGDIPVITFKSQKDENEKLNFGNTEGHNCYEGQDIAVVGTPHMNECAYKMYAVALDVDIKDEQMKYQEIERNNYKFWFMTYDNEDLRDIQLWLIESELQQAIGRARLLRNNCSVFLFSNYPIEQAEFKYL